MAILKIARMGHPVLLRRAEPVADPRDPEIRRLVEDMVETMLDAGGVGLAATDPRLVPYGALTATFHTGLGCLVAPSVLYLAVRALMGG